MPIILFGLEPISLVTLHTKWHTLHLENVIRIIRLLLLWDTTWLWWALRSHKGGVYKLNLLQHREGLIQVNVKLNDATQPPNKPMYRMAQSLSRIWKSLATIEMNEWRCQSAFYVVLTANSCQYSTFIYFKTSILKTTRLGFGTEFWNVGDDAGPKWHFFVSVAWYILKKIQHFLKRNKLSHMSSET